MKNHGSQSRKRRSKHDGNSSSGRQGAVRQTSNKRGFKEGYLQGAQEGKRQFGSIFEGTSIIIPTYNQLELLRNCLASIDQYTDELHEVIVVDNASTDGTGAWLRAQGGKVRFRVLETNRGFAGSVNTGLMMAKGRTLLVLNNDTLVTENWLKNLLQCLNSDPEIGLVGPVTNYSSGDQRIRVPYHKLEDMQAFARKHNQRNPSQWKQTDWLNGFCLLFRRELFEAVGYFDEGFELGHFEDLDYNVRVRLLGKRLVIAGDTFIHHFGSISVKALGDRFQGINERNEAFFHSKWNNPIEWIHRVKKQTETQPFQVNHAAYFYPQRIAVQGTGSTVYWIENGERRPVEGLCEIPVVRVSQMDLKHWPAGESIRAEEAAWRWRGRDHGSGGESGVLVQRDGTCFYLEGYTVRRIANDAVLRSWNLHAKPLRMVSPVELAQRASGLPIFAPPMLKQTL